jgi:hypothetical protein
MVPRLNALSRPGHASTAPKPFARLVEALIFFRRIPPFQHSVPVREAPEAFGQAKMDGAKFLFYIHLLHPARHLIRLS